MRRFTRFLVVAALVLVTLPAHAHTSGQLVVCDPPPPDTTVVGPDHSSTPTVVSPQFSATDWSYIEIQYQLDLSPATATAAAKVSSTLAWEIAANDWDYFLLDGSRDEIDASDGRQPLVAPSESVSGTVRHCGLFRLSILNYQAIGGPAIDMVDPLQISLTTGPVT